MTTIAADAVAGEMCSDALWTDGDECGPARKVFRVRKALLGLAGGMAECRDWLEAYRKADVPPGLNRDFHDVIVLRLDSIGVHIWDNTNGWLKHDGQRYAIGSGGKCARGAMAAGADCRQAVRIAISIDAGTGGSVRRYRLRGA